MCDAVSRQDVESLPLSSSPRFRVQLPTAKVDGPLHPMREGSFEHLQKNAGKSPISMARLAPHLP